MNYPDYNEASGFRPYTFNLDGNISQVIGINTDIGVFGDENDIFTFLGKVLVFQLKKAKKEIHPILSHIQTLMKLLIG